LFFALACFPVDLRGRPGTSACSSPGEPTTSKPGRPRVVRSNYSLCGCFSGFRPGSSWRLDAICDASLAIFLLASSSDALFEFLGLPEPKPALYAKLLGAALVGLAIVEWLVAGRHGQREVGRGVAVGSALAATLIVVWLLSGRLPYGTVTATSSSGSSPPSSGSRQRSTRATAGVPRRSTDELPARLPLSDEP
jgi:hypothetical protein